MKKISSHIFFQKVVLMNGKSPAYFLHNLQKPSTNTESTLTRSVKTRCTSEGWNALHRRGIVPLVQIIKHIKNSGFREYPSFGQAFHIQIQHEAEITSCNDNNAV